MRMYSVLYILRKAPSGPTSRRPLLLLSTAHRLTAAKLGTSRLHGGSGFGNRLGRTSRNACNVMSTCCEKTAAVQQELVNEKDRRNAISAEHFTISHSLLRTQQLLDEARASGEARVKAVEVELAKELVRDRASREQRHQLDLRTLRERSDLLRERATLDVQTAQALAGRLRQERYQARQDALRYNQERNEALAELVALRAQQSAAAVRSALAPIFPLSAE
jgi:hypothetical protein